VGSNRRLVMPLTKVMIPPSVDVDLGATPMSSRRVLGNSADADDRVGEAAYEARLEIHVEHRVG
jgi:hypothetical protein